MTVLDDLNSFSSAKHYNHVIHELVQDKWTLKDACEAVSKKMLWSFALLKKYYQCHGKDESKVHGLNKLTIEEENVLASICMVYSTFHEGLTWHDLLELAKDVYDVDLSKQWFQSFMKCHNNSISERKTKLLANKRFDYSFVEHIAEFIGQVEEVSTTHKLDKATTFDYDKTRMMVLADGTVTLEKIGKACAHHRGIKGKVAGTLVSLIGAEGIIMMSVYIFKGNAEKMDTSGKKTTEKTNGGKLLST